MESDSQNRSTSRWPVYIVLIVLGIVALIFVVALIDSSSIDNGTVEDLTADTYVDTVAALLENSNPADGEALVGKLACAGCHRLGANRIAPSFEGIAERAGARRPPLTAAAYIYESITNPSAYLVSGYAPAMPLNFRDQLSDQELGDIIAYLLTPEAH